MLDYLEKMALGALSPKAEKVVTPADRARLEAALTRLRPAFDELAKWFIEPLRQTKPSRADYGYEQIHHFIAAAVSISSMGTMSDSAQKLAEFEKLGRARDRRAANSPQRRERQLSILRAELAKGGSRREITDRVNIRLEADKLPRRDEKTIMDRWVKKLST
ncbi:hypothetical protein CU048_13820 [Beijerinckiaceae bacterium]|nr:hypothetical protein CU048_13820 [Beijerinckiaceae bacterium]